MADWLVIGIRFALYADLMLMVGLPAFALYALSPDERLDYSFPPLQQPLVGMVSAGLLLTLLGFLIICVAMMGVAPSEIDRDALTSILLETSMGWAAIVRTIALATAALALLGFRKAPRVAYGVAALLGAIALTSLLWNGHAGATEGVIGLIHRVSDALHMVAAALWIGAIAAFAMMLARPATEIAEAHLKTIHRALNQFSRIGAILVAIIVVTGLINSHILFGLANWSSLVGTTYGWLLLAKLLAFGAMLLLAAANRWRLTPAFGRSVVSGGSAPTLAALQKSLAIEAAAAVTVLALVAWIGTVSPDG